MTICFKFSHSVVSDSLRPYGLQHSRPHCPSPTPRAYSNSCPLGQWCHPTISSSVVPFFSCLQSFPASVFSNESALCVRWPKYWSFSFSIGPSNEYSGLISFRMDWLDLLAVQGTLKSLLQHHSSKASIFWCSAFFIVQLSHPYMTIGKTMALTRWTFVGKVMSLLFNMLSRLVITFLPRSKRLLISWLQSPSAVILDCGSNHELLIAKFRLKLKKVGKTTRPFSYDLNQIPNDHTVEVRNRFKGLYLIDRVPDKLWTEVCDIVQETGIKTIPKKKKCKKSKWLSGEALQIAVKRRAAKSKGEKERYTHLNAEFQRIARRDKTTFLSDQCKEIEENNRMGKTRDLQEN